MKCKNCKKDNNLDAQFCKNCGENILTNTAELSEMTDSRKKLEKKPLYRAIKVVYIFLFCISLLILIASTYLTIPEKSIDRDNSSIACYSGKSYSPLKNNIYISSYSNELDYSDDKDARILCKYDTLAFYSHKYEDIEKNYTYIVKYEVIKYGEWFGMISASLFGILMLGYLSKVIFFYVIIGEKPDIKIIKQFI